MSNEMAVMSSNTMTMSSREIAELTGKMHKNVLRDIKELGSILSLTSQQQYYVDSYNKKHTEWLLSKRDTLLLVSGYNVTLRAKIIDRWQELEEGRTTKPKTPNELIAAMALANVEQEKKLNMLEESIKGVKKELEDINEGNIPTGYQPYSHLSAYSGLTKAKCKQLVAAFNVPTQKVLYRTPEGFVSQMAVAVEDAFIEALSTIKEEAEQGEVQWFHPALGRFTLKAR